MNYQFDGQGTANTFSNRLFMGVTTTPLNSIQFALGQNVSRAFRLKIADGQYVD